MRNLIVDELQDSASVQESSKIEAKNRLSFANHTKKNKISTKIFHKTTNLAATRTRVLERINQT